MRYILKSDTIDREHILRLWGIKSQFYSLCINPSCYPSLGDHFYHGVANRTVPNFIVLFLCGEPEGCPPPRQLRIYCIRTLAGCSPQMEDHTVRLFDNVSDNFGGPSHSCSIDDAVVGAPAKVAHLLLDYFIIFTECRDCTHPPDA